MFPQISIVHFQVIFEDVFRSYLLFCGGYLQRATQAWVGYKGALRAYQLSSQAPYIGIDYLLLMLVYLDAWKRG